MTVHPVTSTGRRRFATIAAATVIAVVVIVGVGSFEAVSADPPPAAAGNTSHGFVFDDGVVTTIDHPDATTVPATAEAQAGTATTGINDRGDVLGAFEDPDRVVRQFVRDRKGRYTELEVPLAEAMSTSTSTSTTAATSSASTTTPKEPRRPGSSATTSDGSHHPRARLAGHRPAQDQRPAPGRRPLHRRRHDPARRDDITRGVHGFVWDDGDVTTIDVPGATATLVLGINNHGDTVGSYIDADGRYHGFLRYRRGVVTTLPDAPGADPTSGGTQPAGINDRGHVVGLAYDAAGGSRGFLLDMACSPRSTPPPTPCSPAPSTSTTAARSSVTTPPNR